MTQQEVINQWSPSAHTNPDGPHIVPRDGKCHGDTKDRGLDVIAHGLMDRFAWFQEVSVMKADGGLWIVVKHDYPVEIDIEGYVKTWTKRDFDKLNMSVNWRFIRLPAK